MIADLVFSLSIFPGGGFAAHSRALVGAWPPGLAPDTGARRTGRRGIQGGLAETHDSAKLLLTNSSAKRLKKSKFYPCFYSQTSDKVLYISANLQI